MCLSSLVHQMKVASAVAAGVPILAARNTVAPAPGSVAR